LTLITPLWVACGKDFGEFSLPCTSARRGRPECPRAQFLLPVDPSSSRNQASTNSTEWDRTAFEMATTHALGEVPTTESGCALIDDMSRDWRE
jgi:hypothetical protein